MGLGQGPESPSPRSLTNGLMATPLSFPLHSAPLPQAHLGPLESGDILTPLHIACQTDSPSPHARHSPAAAAERPPLWGNNTR